jgi:hypothetical protein
LWNSKPPTIYMLVDTAVNNALSGIQYKGTIRAKILLERYTNKTRQEMEQQSLWHEFMCEKHNVLDWAFREEGVAADGVFFFDADICFLGPLPTIPTGTEVILSQHLIRNKDEAKFGKYNAGYVWMSNKGVVDVWRQASNTSRYYEQAALECFDAEEWKGRVGYFGPEHNYGWWRLLQGSIDAETLQKQWSIFRTAEHSGIRINNIPLISVHTHWHEKKDFTIIYFNNSVKTMLKQISKSQSKTYKLLGILALP